MDRSASISLTSALTDLIASLCSFKAAGTDLDTLPFAARHVTSTEAVPEIERSAAPSPTAISAAPPASRSCVGMESSSSSPRVTPAWAAASLSAASMRFFTFGYFTRDSSRAR